MPGGSTQTSSQTTNSGPWNVAKPYLKDALDGSPGDRVRMEFMSRVDHTGVRFTCDEDPSWYHTVAPIRR